MLLKIVTLLRKLESQQLFYYFHFFYYFFPLFVQHITNSSCMLLKLRTCSMPPVQKNVLKLKTVCWPNYNYSRDRLA